VFVKLRFWFWILYEVVIILGRIKAGFIALRIKIGIFIDLVKLFSPILIFLLSIDVKPRADDDVPSFSPDWIFLDFREFYQFAMGCRESTEPKLQDFYKKFEIMKALIYGSEG